MSSPGEIVAAPALKDKLRKLGLERSVDLILHLPLRYEDETIVTPIASAPEGEPVQIEEMVRYV